METEKIFNALNQIKLSIDQHKDEIEKLDQQIGDGDHIFNIQRGIKEFKMVAVATVLRLWVGLAVALGLLELLQVDTLTRNALLVQAAAPTAVITIVLATEFNSRPALATGAVVISTIASIPTLTLLLSVLTR